MTGYDLVFYIRKWLTENSHDIHSVCEVILLDDKFKHIRDQVGIANVFWSHIQLEPFAGLYTNLLDEAEETQRMYSTLYTLLDVDNRDSANILPPRDSRYHWLDYFTLCPFQQDVVPKAIHEVIKDIGIVAAAVNIGRGIGYLGRSFCILEMYGAVAGGCKLVCWTNMPTMSKAIARTMFAASPVDVRAAKTRRPEDKEIIDSFIEQCPGAFDHINATIADTIISACPGE